MGVIGGTMLEKPKQTQDIDGDNAHITHDCNVHELPVARHRVTHDTFIDGDHAELGSDEMVELHPFGCHRFPKIIDNVVELRPDYPDEAA